MIDIDEQLDRASRYLGAIPGAAERAMARALNAATSSASSEAQRAIGARYAVRPGDVAGMITTSPATPSRLEAAITARSRALSVGYFPHSPTAGGTGGPGKPQLQAEILRGASKDIAGAFVANLSSGPRVMRRTGNGRQILSVYTIPLAAMLGTQSVRGAIEDRAEVVLDDKLDREIDRELKAAAS